MAMRFLLLFFTISITTYLNAQTVTTIAGIVETSGSANGQPFFSTFNNPHGIAVDTAGNVYVADRFNHKIRKIDKTGQVSTFAGSGNIGSANGIGETASFYEPWGVATDIAGNVYVADTKNNKIRKITPTGLVSTFAGNGSYGFADSPSPLNATFGNPSGIVLDKSGNIYVADHLTHIIRKISPSGNVKTFAGSKINYPNNHGDNDGQGSSARFYRPYGIALDKDGNLFVADEWNHKIRKITPSGNVTTYAGIGTIGATNGAGDEAQFNFPWDVAIDDFGNIFVMDGYNHVVRKINLVQKVSTYVGTVGTIGAQDGEGAAASFNGATGIFHSKKHDAIYIADAYNHLIRKILPVSPTNPQIALSSGSICYTDSVKVTVQPEIFNTYEYYVDGLKVLTSYLSEVYLKNIAQGNHQIEVHAFFAGAEYASEVAILDVISSPKPFITANEGLEFCEGDSIVLRANGGTSYLWSTGAISDTIVVKTGGKYYLQNIANACPSERDSATVTVHPKPNDATVTVTGNTEFCFGDSVIFAAPEGYNYLWSNKKTTRKITVKESGEYWVKVLNDNSCSLNSDTFQVKVKPVPPRKLYTQDSTTFCQGDSAILAAPFVETYLWSNGKTSQSIVVREEGKYYAYLTNSFGCSVYSDTIETKIKPLPDVNINLSITEQLYIGDTVTLTASGGTDYLWSNNAITQSIKVSKDGKYWVTATADNKCTATSDTINLVFKPILPDGETMHIRLIGDEEFCEGDTAILKTNVKSNINWYKDNEIIKNEIDTMITVRETGEYNYTYTYLTGKKLTSDKVEIIVYPMPKVSFTASDTVLSAGKNIVDFTNNSTNNCENNWNFGDSYAGINNHSSQINPSHTYTIPGVYTVSLTVTCDGICSKTLKKENHISYSNRIFVPNAFSPNGDGLNDNFVVKGGFFKTFDLKIFNQWGEMIYQTNESSKGWDGTQNGVPLGSGNFVYLINGIDFNGKEVNLHGKISIVK